MYAPFNFQQLNVIEGTYTPSMQKNYNNKAFDFWVRALFQRACSALIIDLPTQFSKDGRKDFFYYTLFRNGFLTFTEVTEFGLIFQPCTVNGYDLYYQPKKVLITNALITESVERTIGEDCVVVKLTPDFMGVWDIIEYYAEKLALLDSAINMATINSKLAFVFGAKNKVVGEALKKIYDKISQGEPTVIFDKKLTAGLQDEDTEPWFDYTRNVKDSYILTDLLQDMQTTLNAFDCEIGIPTVPYQKKERMVTSEAESKQLDATSRATVWLETLKTCFAEVKAKYNIDISVRLRYDPNESEVLNNGKTDNAGNM